MVVKDYGIGLSTQRLIDFLDIENAIFIKPRKNKHDFAGYWKLHIYKQFPISSKF